VNLVTATGTDDRYAIDKRLEDQISRRVYYRVLTQVLGQKEHRHWEGRPLPGTPAFRALQEVMAGALEAQGRRTDPFVATSALWAFLHGTVSLRSARPAFPWPPLEAMLDALLGDLLPGRTPTPPPSA
jgi:hypothetical protein